MSKSKVARIAGFTVALGATASLAGFAATGTGAYFTDSHSGQVNTSTGDVKVNTSDLTLNYTNLLPDNFQTNTVNYTAAGTGPEDIWLVLPTDGTALAFNGPGGTDGPLGRYGHFAVHSPGGDFTSYNLASKPSNSTDPSSPCPVDGNGHGGSSQQATSHNNSDPGSYVPYCPVPGAILLSSGLTNGQTGSADITFGFTKLLTNPQDAPLTGLAHFKIVATQHGINPTDVNN